VKPKSANHVSHYTNLSINSARLYITPPTQPLFITFNAALLFGSVSQVPTD